MAKFSDKIKQSKQNKTNIISKADSFGDPTNFSPEMSENIPDDIEEIESQINKLKERMWKAAWLIGKRLINIRENHLEKLGYDNIHAYAFDKFEFKHATTYRFIYMASNYDLFSAQRIGAKLHLLQSLDEEKRKLYLEWIEKDNPSYRDIQQRIKDETKKPGRPKNNLSISKKKITVNLNQMKRELIPTEKEKFINELNTLIEKYTKEIN